MPEGRLQRTRDAYREPVARDKQSGIAIRFLRQFDIQSNIPAARYDAYGPFEFDALMPYPTEPKGVKIING